MGKVGLLAPTHKLTSEQKFEARNVLDRNIIEEANKSSSKPYK